MPSFYPSHPGSLPLTPPEYENGYASNGCGTMDNNQPFYVGPARPNVRQYNGFDYNEQFSQPQSAFPSRTMDIRSRPLPNMPFNNGGISVNQPHDVYNSIHAPILPPIRLQDQAMLNEAIPPEYRPQEQRPFPEQQPRAKEEKSVGGVAAVLDYEMDQMADFVSEMAQGMYELYISKLCLADIDMMRSVHPGSAVNPQFRKYVSQVLSSTRLPSSTIIAGLYYLANRMSMLSESGKYNPSSGQVYHMLTTALILGSKFLDDNTFQNRSWAEVSNIPVAELNTLEAEWLTAIEYRLHFDPNTQDGFQSWKLHWHEYQAKYNKPKASTMLKPAPIDTTMQRQRSTRKVHFSPDCPIPPQYAPAAMEQFYPRRERTPPSAPHTGPNTPEYYGAGAWSGYLNPPPPYSMRTMPQSSQMHQSLQLPSQPPSYHHTPFAQPYAQSFWTGHGTSCNCPYCIRHNEQYLMPSSYGMQPVAG